MTNTHPDGEIAMIMQDSASPKSLWDIEGTAWDKGGTTNNAPRMMAIKLGDVTICTQNGKWFRNLIDAANAALIAGQHAPHKTGASTLGDLRYVDFTAMGLMGEEITCGANLGKSGFVFEIKDGDQFTMFSMANEDAIRLSDSIKPTKITPELFGAATAAVLEASESGKMFEDEPYNIVKAVMKVFGLELEAPAKDGKDAA
ncbi:MAG: hypothetical protein VX620_15325 [Pseudomonadota bacterium]|nr:hypothetical protein [Pseudomonadota bacterium]